ncbi:MAG: hypothetical protein KF718_10490 [Polyangiaceae bacterium]|nr:hypothetical protein [Polyangiaceae bacterium]
MPTGASTEGRGRARAVALVAAGLALLGCKPRASAPAEAQPGAASAAPAAASSARGHDAPAPRVPARVGCWSDAPVGMRSPREQLAALEQHCLSGTVTLAEGSAHADEPLSAELPEGVSCVRAVGAAEGAHVELELALVGPGGPSSDGLDGPLAVVPADGPRCFRGPTTVELTVRTTPSAKAWVRLARVSAPSTTRAAGPDASP